MQRMAHLNAAADQQRQQQDNDGDVLHANAAKTRTSVKL